MNKILVEISSEIITPFWINRFVHVALESSLRFIKTRSKFDCFTPFSKILKRYEGYELSFELSVNHTFIALSGYSYFCDTWYGTDNGANCHGWCLRKEIIKIIFLAAIHRSYLSKLISDTHPDRSGGSDSAGLALAFPSEGEIDCCECVCFSRASDLSVPGAEKKYERIWKWNGWTNSSRIAWHCCTRSRKGERVSLKYT